MPLKLNSSGGGSVTLQEPTTSSNRTLTLPDNTGTVITTASTFAGTGPAFSAYPSVDQSFSGSTWTKVTFGTEGFDTNSNFASSRFTPTVAGYYQINASIFLSYTSSAPSIILTAIYKNGSGYRSGYSANAGGSASGPYGAFQISDIVYLNGSTDYVEIYVWSNSATAFVDAAVSSVPTAFFSGALVRAE